MNTTTKVTAEKPVTASVFTKEQIVRSKRYSDRQDLLEAILKPDKKYTYDEVDGIISNYVKGKVK